MNQRKFILLLGLAMAASLLWGCACNPGYYAPPYKLTTVGCAPAWVPTR